MIDIINIVDNKEGGIIKLKNFNNLENKYKILIIVSIVVILGAIIFVVFSYSLYQKQDESLVANGVVDQFCNECQVVFNANGGTNTTNSITVLNEEQYGTLPTPTRNYYTFAGWYTEASGGNKITSSTVVNLRDTQTLYAHWTPINYTISYTLNGGTISGQKTSYNADTATFTLPTPTKTGYTFVGWTGSNGTTASKSVSIAKGSGGNRTYTANWTPTNYTITYNLNNGSLSGQKVTYNIETATFTLPTPTKYGNTFKGWTGSNGSTASKSVSIAKGSTGNKTYTANWQTIAKCVRAATLHTEVCSNGDVWSYCSYSKSDYNGSDVKNGDTITYGSYGTKGTLAAGNAFTCDVNGDGTFDEATERFYYVSDLYTGTSSNVDQFDSNYAVLIYYNSTISGVSNNTSARYGTSDNHNWYGPVLAVENLPSTTQWSNVRLKSQTRQIRNELGTTVTTGGTIVNFTYTNRAARLITLQEMKKACGTSISVNTHGYLDTTTCRFFMENTKYTFSDWSVPTSYWLETPSSSKEATIWVISTYDREIYDGYYGLSGPYGVRPVIEVKKTDMSY